MAERRNKWADAAHAAKWTHDVLQFLEMGKAELKTLILPAICALILILIGLL
jgi:hypothetical protein